MPFRLGRRLVALQLTTAICGLLGPVTSSTEAKAEPAKSTGAEIAQWPAPPKAPTGAPNVIVILTDDVGFGASSTFGGAIPTPNLDALAAKGVRYNNFNTTAICSPTRASLLTGRYPHNAGMGKLTDFATNYEGYQGYIPKSTATIAEILKRSGYSTAMFGKSHLAPAWEQSQSGPFDRWPTGLGFEYYYGFLQGDANQWAPALYENTRPVATTTREPDYILDRDLTDRAIGWIRDQKATNPDKPFFVYFASGTAHAPNHAPKEWPAAGLADIEIG